MLLFVVPGKTSFQRGFLFFLVFGFKTFCIKVLVLFSLGIYVSYIDDDDVTRCNKRGLLMPIVVPRFLQMCACVYGSSMFVYGSNKTLQTKN